MIVLDEQLWVARPRQEVFAYAGEFGNCEQWDSTARESVKLTEGETGPGTEYRVVCSLPLGSLTLRYQVLQWQPPEQVVLEGSCRWFTVRDTITLTDDGEGTRLDYRAEFTFNTAMSHLESSMQPGFERMGRASVQGLLQALEDNFPVPAFSADASLGDRWILPGLAGFTRWGYERRQRHFQPVSAFMADKHVLLTGATSGIGYAAAADLAASGASLTLVARDQQRGLEAVERLQHATGNREIVLELADMSSMQDVRSLVDRLLRAGRPIDVLINNAGALFNPRQETAEGMEKSLALLYLGPCLLTEGVLPLLEASAHTARVINVVSGGMYSQKLDVDALCGEQSDYSGSVAYARAKRALMVQTEQWAESWKQRGVVCNAMHPGWADTPGVRSSLPAFYRLTRGLLRSPQQGADTLVWLASASEAAGVSGQLFLDRQSHAAHWLKRTRESRPERAALDELLSGVAARFT